MIERARLFIEALPFLTDAMDLIARQYNHDDVFAEYMQGRCHLIMSDKPAVLSRIETNPRGKTCEIWLCGGELEDLLKNLLPQVERWGLMNGCQDVAYIGRNGWLKKMDEHGYRNGGASMWRAL